MSFTWEHGRQMKTFTNSEGSTWEYTYDDSGYRTKKKLLNTTYEYMLDGSQVVCMKTPTNTVWFYYDATGQRVAMDIGGTVYYYMYNLMGDVLGLYDGAGNVVARYAYDAWGKILSIKDGSGNLLNPTSNPLAPGIVNPFRYRGYMYDTESGLYYLNSRYYDPETGRFVNADSTAMLGIDMTSTNHINLYNYCDNNPVMRHDPNGMFWSELLDEIGNQASLYAVAGGMAMADGPIPVGDIFAAMLAVGVTVYAITQVEIASDIAIPEVKLGEKDATYPPPDTVFYYVYLNYPGAMVSCTEPMDVIGAIYAINTGGNVWAPNAEYAMLLCTLASGGYVGPENNSGKDAMHFHLKDRQGNAHVFFGYDPKLEFFTW